MQRFLSVTFICCFLFQYIAKAQNSPVQNFCGTSAEKNAWLEKFQLESHAQHTHRGVVQYIPLSIHIVGDDNGKGYFELAKLDVALCQLNKDYEPVGFQFYIKGEIDYINNSEWFSHADFDAGYDLLNQNKVPKSMNCFTVADAAGNCGYSVYGKGVVLKGSCIQEGSHTWAHEMGHAFSLPHTFSGWEGETYENLEQAPITINGNQVERADGSNCFSAGDGFCDTPADYLSYRWYCNDDNFAQPTCVDPVGTQFVVDGKYFMSYALDQCESIFSDEQIVAMQANLADEKANLLNQATPEPDINNMTITGLSPAENSMDVPINTTITWEPVAGADHYIFQLSRFQNFAVSDLNLLLDEPFINVENLKPGKKYFWRVRARNSFSFCNVFSAQKTFTTQPTSGTNNIADEDWRVSPTVLNQNGTIRIELPEAAQIYGQVVTIFGESMQKIDFGGDISSEYLIPVNQWKPGIYFLQITAGAVHKVFKVIVVS